MTLEERYYNYCKFAIKNFIGEMVHATGYKLEKYLYENTKALPNCLDLWQELSASDNTEMMIRVHEKIDKEYKK